MKFKDVLIDKFHFSESEVEYSKKMFDYETIQTKKFFLEEGKVATKLGIVITGLFRTFFINEDGNEITTAFHEPNTLLLSIDSFTNQVKSKENIVAIVTSEIMTITFTNWELLNQEIPKWQEVRKKTGDYIGMSLQARARDFQIMSAKERYKKFCQKHPIVYQKATLGQIASYLGIDIATLSRIRRTI